MCIYVLLCVILCHCVSLCVIGCHFVLLCVIVCHFVSLCVIVFICVSLCAIECHFVSLCVIVCHCVILCYFVSLCILRAQDLLLSIYWLNCLKVESHFALLIELISNCCSNLNKLGTLVDFGLSQAHKEAHAHIWSIKVFFHKVYYSFSWAYKTYHRDLKLCMCIASYHTKL